MATSGGSRRLHSIRYAVCTVTQSVAAIRALAAEDRYYLEEPYAKRRRGDRLASWFDKLTMSSQMNDGQTKLLP